VHGFCSRCVSLPLRAPMEARGWCGRAGRPARAQELLVSVLQSSREPQRVRVAVCETHSAPGRAGTGSLVRSRVAHLVDEHRLERPRPRSPRAPRIAADSTPFLYRLANMPSATARRRSPWAGLAAAVAPVPLLLAAVLLQAPSPASAAIIGAELHNVSSDTTQFSYVGRWRSDTEDGVYQGASPFQSDLSLLPFCSRSAS